MDNDIQWRGVRVQKTGRYMLTLTYFCGEDRDISLEISGKGIGTFTTHSRNWKKAATMKLPIALKKGDNIIRLYNAGNWMPDIDRMELRPQ